jgi:DeoR/GlpR family transcriptional regulator of sugar metabolism
VIVSLFMLAETRRREIAQTLRESGSITVAEVESRYGVSPMTARRDLAELERRGVVRRTHGGAVLPTVSAHEDSFARRLKIATDAKRRLAEAAVARLAPNETVFLDSSTTSYFVASRIVETGLAVTLLTNSLPVLELAFDEAGPELEVIAVGGTLRRLTRSFVGPFSIRTVLGHFADRLFLSVKGLTETGMLTDADPLEAEVKRTMIQQAGTSTLLIESSKLSTRGLTVISSASELTDILAVGVTAAQVTALRTHGATVAVVGAEDEGAAGRPPGGGRPGERRPRAR